MMAVGGLALAPLHSCSGFGGSFLRVGGYRVYSPRFCCPQSGCPCSYFRTQRNGNAIDARQELQIIPESATAHGRLIRGPSTAH